MVLGNQKMLTASKISKICLFGRMTGLATSLFKIFFDKMVSILINIIQHEQYFFSFQAKVLLYASSSQSHATSCLSLSYYPANNKCKRVKGRRWRWLIYTLCNFLLHNNTLRFSDATTTVLESPTGIPRIPQENTCVGVSF